MILYTFIFFIFSSLLFSYLFKLRLYSIIEKIVSNANMKKNIQYFISITPYKFQFILVIIIHQSHYVYFMISNSMCIVPIEQILHINRNNKKYNDSFTIFSIPRLL